MGDMKFFQFLLILLGLISCTTGRKDYYDTKLPSDLEAAISAGWRLEENTERDQYQHPLETLKFFGLTQTLTVVEVSPGSGYFTEILAPYLAPKGHLYLAVPRLPPRPALVLLENEKKIQDIFLRHKEVQTKTRIIPFEPIDKRNKIRKNFADLVLSFNSVHNWIATKTAVDSFKFFYNVLKPNGILGIVQHKIPDGKANVLKSGYMYEDEVIKLAQAAGFKLAGRSEINANPKDTADYPKGVWTLPPTYRLGEDNKRTYKDIGESNRMTLKFIKQ